MSQRTDINWGYLLGALGVVVAMIFVATWSTGVSRGLKADLSSQQEFLNEAIKETTEAKNELSRSVGERPVYTEVLGADWQQRITAAEEQLASLKSELDILAKDISSASSSEESTLSIRLQRIADQRREAEAKVTTLFDQFESIQQVVENTAAAIQAGEADYQAIQNLDLSTLRATVMQAASDWPEKRTTLMEQFESLQQTAQQSVTDWQSVQQQQRPGDQVDFVELNKALNGLQAARTTLEAGRENLKDLTEQLYVAWDKILVDMDRSGSRYRHKYRFVRTRVEPNNPDAQPETNTEEVWTDVPRSSFQQMEDKLGMAVAHKPAGAFDYEAENTAQPPGYAYMAPVGERNRYGYWRSSPGGSLWVFYGQYAFMRDMFWGPRYSPIYARDYRSYRSSMSSGRTYYGRDSGGKPKYGTGGTYTKSKYSSNRYFNSSNYRNSKYAPRSARRGSSRSRSWGRGSRSWGGK